MWQPTHVKVTVQKARGLIYKGKNNTNDAYVVIALGKEKFQTSIREKSINPVEWKEECELAIPTQGNTAALQLTVFHRNSLGLDEFLGLVQFPLSELDVYERPKKRWCSLKGKPEKDKKKGEKDRGELEVCIAFTVNSGSLADLSKKEKHKSSLSSLKHLGHRIDKIAHKPSKHKDKKGNVEDWQGFPSEMSHSRQRTGDADPGVISESDDEDFGFNEEVTVNTRSGSPLSSISRGSLGLHGSHDEGFPVHTTSNPFHARGTAVRPLKPSHVGGNYSPPSTTVESPPFPYQSSPPFLVSESYSRRSNPLKLTNSGGSEGSSDSAVESMSVTSIQIKGSDQLSISETISLSDQSSGIPNTEIVSPLFVPVYWKQPSSVWLDSSTPSNVEIKGSSNGDGIVNVPLVASSLTPLFIASPESVWESSPSPPSVSDTGIMNVQPFDRASFSRKRGSGRRRLPVTPKLNSTSLVTLDSTSVQNYLDSSTSDAPVTPLSSLSKAHEISQIKSEISPENPLISQSSGKTIFSISSKTAPFSSDNSSPSVHAIPTALDFSDDRSNPFSPQLLTPTPKQRISKLNKTEGSRNSDVQCTEGTTVSQLVTNLKRSGDIDNPTILVSPASFSEKISGNPFENTLNPFEESDDFNDVSITEDPVDLPLSKSPFTNRNLSPFRRNVSPRTDKKSPVTSVFPREQEKGTMSMSSSPVSSHRPPSPLAVKSHLGAPATSDRPMIRSGSLRNTVNKPPATDDWESKLYGRSAMGSVENLQRSESKSPLSGSRASSSLDISEGGDRFPQIKEEEKKKRRIKAAGLKGLFHSVTGSRERLEEGGRVVEGGNDRLPNSMARQSRLPQEIHDKFAGKSREDLLEMIVNLQSNMDRQSRKTRDLEDYIDELLLRVMENTPHILQAPISPPRKIK